MGCGHSATRRVYPVQSSDTEGRATAGGQQPHPPYKTTVSMATQTPPLIPEDNDDKISSSSDSEHHVLDKVILVQPSKSDDVKKENESDESEENVLKPNQEEDKKCEDGVKIVLTVPSVPAGDEGSVEIVELDTEGDHEEKGAGRSPSKVESEKGREGVDEIDGGTESVAKTEQMKQDIKKEQTVIDTEDVPTAASSPIPIPGSKSDKEVIEEKNLEKVGGEKKEAAAEADKQDEQVRPDSTQNASSLEASPKVKQQQYETDPTAKSSHPFKPLPNIDEGITATKSEPRLPLLPPIGSKKITSLQENNGVLKSHSVSGLCSDTSAKDSMKERRKEEEHTSARPKSDLATTTKKRKSTDTLRSTSGSSISKSKRSSSSSSGVSLGQKSKSKESLKAGVQSRLSAGNSRSSDNLVNGAAKKLSISRESLKAANNVYSTAPPTKSGEPHKRGDSSKSNSSKSKERKSSGPQKQPKKKEEIAPAGNSENTSIEKESKEKDSPATEEKQPSTHQPPSVEKQPDATKKTDTVSGAPHSTAIEDSSPGNQASQESSKVEEKVQPDDVSQGDNTGQKEVKVTDKQREDEAVEKIETSDRVSIESPEARKTDQKKQTLPPSEVHDNSSTKSKESDKATQNETESENLPQTSNVQPAQDRGQLMENPETSVTTKPQAKEISVVASDDTTSRSSSAEFVNKVEIDQKTGQSEQSIVEAVEKSTNLPPSVTNERSTVTTPA